MREVIKQSYWFDEFTLDLVRGCLLGGNDLEIKLRPKSFCRRFQGRGICRFRRATKLIGRKSLVVLSLIILGLIAPALYFLVPSKSPRPQKIAVLPFKSLNYTPAAAGIDADLAGPMGPIEPVLERVDPILITPIRLTDDEFRELVDFVRNGLLDEKATPENLRRFVPRSVPSGFPVLVFR